MYIYNKSWDHLYTFMQKTTNLQIVTSCLLLTQFLYFWRWEQIVHHGGVGGRQVFVESPPSPLSLMDVITVGSPIPITGGLQRGDFISGISGGARDAGGISASSMEVSDSASSSVVTVASAGTFPTALEILPHAKGFLFYSFRIVVYKFYSNENSN